MIKSELVSAVSFKTGVTTEDVRKVVEAAFTEIQKSVKNGDGFYCRGFGSFTKKRRAQKTARNISQGTSLIIPEHSIPHFKPAPDFLKAVR